LLKKNCTSDLVVCPLILQDFKAPFGSARLGFLQQHYGREKHPSSKLTLAGKAGDVERCKKGL